MLRKSSIGSCGFEKLILFVEISEILKNIGNFEKLSREAPLLFELSERELGWRFTARCHTETVAKPGRLRPAQNDKPMQNFIELTRFWIIYE